MKRSNIRFTKRVKVRNGDEERILYLEKLNDMLLQQYVVQDNINKGLIGRITGETKKRTKMRTDMVDRFASMVEEIKELRFQIKTGASTMENMMVNMNTMEEVLEDLS